MLLGLLTMLLVRQCWLGTWHSSIMCVTCAWCQVAYANTVGSILLLKAAQKTGHDTFEGIAQAAGGKPLKVLQFMDKLRMRSLCGVRQLHA